MYIEFNYENLIASICMACFISQFFNGFRCYAIAIFIIAWQFLTPIQKWYFDIPAMISLIIATEILYRRINNN